MKINFDGDNDDTQTPVDVSKDGTSIFKSVDENGDDRHVFEFSFRSRLAGGDWWSEPRTLTERAHDLHTALEQVTARPFTDWFQDLVDLTDAVLEDGFLDVVHIMTPEGCKVSLNGQGHLPCQEHT